MSHSHFLGTFKMIYQKVSVQENQISICKKFIDIINRTIEIILTHYVFIYFSSQQDDEEEKKREKDRQRQSVF